MGRDAESPPEPAGKPSRRRRADPMVDAHLGQRIRRLRRRAGVSQQALAARLGVSFQQVQKYENGKNRVSASTLWRLAEALGAPVGQFFEGLLAAPGAADDGTLGEALLNAAGGPALARAYLAAPAGEVRRALVVLAEAAAGAADPRSRARTPTDSEQSPRTAT